MARGGGTPGRRLPANVGGSVSGVPKSGLVLQLNGGSDLSLDVDRPFTFDTAVAGAEPVLDVGVV